MPNKITSHNYSVIPGAVQSSVKRAPASAVKRTACPGECSTGQNYETPSMSVKLAWDWSTVATCFPRGPEIAVRVAGGRLQHKIASVAMLTICLIIKKRDHKKF